MTEASLDVGKASSVGKYLPENLYILLPPPRTGEFFERIKDVPS